LHDGFALVNIERYSITTAKHLSNIRGALRGLMPYFHCSDVTNVKLAVKENTESLNAVIELLLNKNKVTSKEDIEYQLYWVKDRHKSLNSLRSFARLKPIKLDA